MEYQVQYRAGRRWVTLDVCGDRHAALDAKAERIAALVDRGFTFCDVVRDFRVQVAA